MNPIVSLVTEVEVAAADGDAVTKTMEDTVLMDRWWCWRREGL